MLHNPYWYKEEKTQELIKPQVHISSQRFTSYDVQKLKKLTAIFGREDSFARLFSKVREKVT